MTRAAGGRVDRDRVRALRRGRRRRSRPRAHGRPPHRRAGVHSPRPAWPWTAARGSASPRGRGARRRRCARRRHRSRARPLRGRAGDHRRPGAPHALRGHRRGHAGARAANRSPSAAASAAPPRPQRRALLRRDGGCARPGCPETRIERLHAHHMRHWLFGGRTELTNLVLLCDVDHGLVHDHGLVLSRQNGRLIVPTPTAGVSGAPPTPPSRRTDRFDGTERALRPRGRSVRRRPSLRRAVGRRPTDGPRLDADATETATRSPVDHCSVDRFRNDGHRPDAGTDAPYRPTPGSGRRRRRRLTHPATPPA